ncbi:MAG: hypothetical protein B7Z55_00305 [Planctomycetales bacterium 12-60-4]|nr:MAG: hypothetical protein B7Z55_00305 [Planctomycetales bacterium 12-60-4]
MRKKEIGEVARIRDIMHQAGLKATASRLAMIRLLRKTNSPMSNAQIAKRIVPHGFHQSTVPRLLARLVDAGLVRQLNDENNAKLFQWNRPSMSHAAPECKGVAIADVA